MATIAPRSTPVLESPQIPTVDESAAHPVFPHATEAAAPVALTPEPEPSVSWMPVLSHLGERPNRFCWLSLHPDLQLHPAVSDELPAETSSQSEVAKDAIVRLDEEILPDESRETLCQLQHMLEESPQQYYLQLETTEAQLMTPQEVEDLLWVSQPGITDGNNESEEVTVGHYQELAPGEAAILNPTINVAPPAAEDVSARAFLPLVLVQRQVRRRWLSCAMVLERPLVEVTNELALNRMVWPERLKQHSLSVVLGVSIAGLWAAGAVQSLLGGAFHPLRDKMAHGMTTYAAPSRILTQEAQQLLPAKALSEAAEIPESLHVVDDAFLKDKLLQRLDEETFEKMRAEEAEKALQKVRKAAEAKRRKMIAHLTLPLRGLITSRFGHRWGRLHRGLDISAPVGTSIHAAQEGVVETVHFEQGYGLTITMRHPSGLKTRYAHCQRAFVRAGQRVTLGTRIAAIGMTGNTTGPHLHFEVLKNGVIQNPDKFLNG